VQKLKIGTTRYMTTAFAVGAAALLATTAGAGSASAQDPDVFGRTIAKCEGLSPHIIDVPHMDNLRVSQGEVDPGTVNVYVDPSLDIWGYDSHPTITWTNLATGASGVLAGQMATRNLANSKGVSYKGVPTGSGPVRFDLSMVDNGTFPMPPVTCTGNFDVR